jgi:hypothetical protein
LSSAPNDVDSGSNDNTEATGSNVTSTSRVAGFDHIVADSIPALPDGPFEGIDHHYWFHVFPPDAPPPLRVYSSFEEYRLSFDSYMLEVLSGLATASPANLHNDYPDAHLEDIFESVEHAQVATSSAYTLDQYVFLLIV